MKVARGVRWGVWGNAPTSVGQRALHLPNYLNDSEMLIALGPEHAATIAADGWCKEDVQKFIFEQARVPVKRAKLGGMWGMADWPNWLHTQDDETRIPVVRRWEDIIVIVCGGAGKHSSCVPTFGATRSVTRAISD